MSGKTGKDGSGGTRQWTSRDRAKMSLFQVFRESHMRGDSKASTGKTDDGDAEISTRSKYHREGIPKDLLRAHLQADLNALLNTIRLDSTVSLEDAPYVAASIVNYGFQDLSNVAASELNTPAITQSIRKSLQDHEPRLIPGSIEVTVIEQEEDADQRLSLAISAELIGDPVDIPVDFEADVDLGAGKLRMSKLRVQT